MFGLIFIIVGAAFLLKNFGYISADAWDIIWPSLLIAFGVYALVQRKSHGFCWDECWHWLKKGEEKER